MPAWGQPITEDWRAHGDGSGSSPRRTEEWGTWALCKVTVSSWRTRLYCIATSFVFTKEVKEQPHAAITRWMRQQWNWGMNLLLALSHDVPSAPRTWESRNVCTHTLLRGGWDPSLCLLLPSLFEQILPGDLGLACSQSLGGELSCGCYCVVCGFDKDKIRLQPQLCWPAVLSLPSKHQTSLGRNTSEEIL